MGGRQSRPPPPPPPPVVSFYYQYFDIPSNAQQRINDMNNQIESKKKTQSNLQWELNTALNNQRTATTEKEYWKNLSIRLQTQINALNSEISGLQKQVDDLKDKLSKATTQLAVANSQTAISQTAIQDLTSKNVDANYKNLDTKTLYYKTIEQQNKILINQYDDLRSGLTRGDVLSSYVFGKNGNYDKINYIFFIAYFVLVAILLGLFIFISTGLSRYFKISILIIAVLYPFIILLTESYMYELVRYIYSIAVAEPYNPQ